MRLFELSDDEKLKRVITATSELQTQLENGEITSNWTMDELIDHYGKYDLNLVPKDFFGMFEKFPLFQKIVSDINGKEVMFKGIEQPEAPVETPPPEQSQEVVAKMAKNAMPK